MSRLYRRDMDVFSEFYGEKILRDIEGVLIIQINVQSRVSNSPNEPLRVPAKKHDCLSVCVFLS